MKSFISKKVGFGKVAMPLWSVGLALAITAAAAGQAVGPILSGSVSGEVGATVSQSIIVDTTLPLNSRVTVSGDVDNVAVSNDEGTHFTVAYETYVGDTVEITVNLDNLSDADASAKLVLDIPSGVAVELDSAVDIEEPQLSRNTWLLSVGDDGTIVLTVEPKDDFKPGVFQISGRLTQIEG